MLQALWSLNWHLNKTTLSPLCAAPEVVKPTPCHWLAPFPPQAGKNQGWMEMGDHQADTGTPLFSFLSLSSLTFPFLHPVASTSIHGKHLHSLLRP